MAKVQVSKKRASIDMTAMCDVSFLLLSFFIMSSTAKVPEPMPVDMPASTVQTKLPDSKLAVITVGKEGTTFFGVVGQPVRIRTLELMAREYNMTFTEEELKRFSLIDEFGVPMNKLKPFIALNSSDRNADEFKIGIPSDSTDNQLDRWVYNARLATKEIELEKTNGQIDMEDKTRYFLDIAIKGDAKEQYPHIKKVIDMLQYQKINKFYLVTNLRGEDF